MRPGLEAFRRDTGTRDSSTALVEVYTMNVVLNICVLADLLIKFEEEIILCHIYIRANGGSKSSTWLVTFCE